MTDTCTYSYGFLDPTGRLSNLPTFELEVDLFSLTHADVLNVQAGTALSNCCGPLQANGTLSSVHIVMLHEGQPIADAGYLTLHRSHLTHAENSFVFNRYIWRLCDEGGKTRATVAIEGTEVVWLTRWFRNHVLQS